MKKFTLLATIVVLTVISMGQNQFPAKQLSDVHPGAESPKMDSDQSSLTGTTMYQVFKNSKSKSADDYGNPPSWSNLLHFGGSGADHGYDIITDENGDIYACGSFSGMIQYDDNTWNSTGHWDGWVAKYDDDGALIWLKQIQASTNDFVEIFGVHIDQDGNILITGYHTGIIQLDGIQLNSIAEQSLFFARLDPEGNTLMAKNHGNNLYLETGTVIDTDEDNNIYIIGSTNGDINFSSSSVILKYDSSGTLLYSEYSQENYCDMKVIGQNIYFAGTVIDEGYIGGFYLDPVSYRDAYIAKANVDLEYLWVDMASHEESWGDSYAVGLDVDDQDNIYLTGYYRTNIGFGEYFLNEFWGSFVVKFNTDEQALWLINFSNYYDETKSITLGEGNDLFVFGTNRAKVFDKLTGNTQHEIFFLETLKNCTYNTNTNECIVIGMATEEIYMCAYSNSLNKQWVTQYPGNSARGYVINSRGDKYGNTYALNLATNTIDYFGTEVENGLFLSKQNSSGEVMWLKNFPDIYMDPQYGSFLEIDTVNEFVYCTGYFDEYFIIPGETTLVAGLEGSIFILKYDFEGNYQWSNQLDFDSYSLSVAPSVSGHIYIGGLFNETVTIGNKTLVSKGNDDCFIAKLNADGDFEWAQGIGGSTDPDYSCLIAVDENDNVYFASESTATEIYFENYQLTLNEGDGNIVFARFDENGNLLWATSKAGSPMSYGDWYCWPTGLETDADGNILMKGWHGDSTNFDDVLLRSLYNNYSKFIAKFNPEGNTIWAKSINETRYGYDYNQMSTDEAGNAYLGISLRDTIYFEDIYMYPCADRNDLLVAKYDVNGLLEWAKFIQGESDSYARISSVSALSNNYVLCSGYFGGLLQLEEESMNSDNFHGFMVSIGEGTGMPENDGVSNIPLIRVFPNPSDNLVNIKLPSSCNFAVSLKDNTGRSVVKKTSHSGDQHIMDVSTLPGGIYYLIIEAEESTEIIKLILE